MKFRFVILSIIIIGLILNGCESKKPVDKQKSREILSSRTLGLAYLEENKLNEAEAEFLKLIDLAPDEALGHANLGLVYLRMGNYEDAEKNLIDAIKIQPDDPDIRLILAKVYELEGQEDLSIDELNKIMEIAPDHAKTLYSLAEIYDKSKDEKSLALKEDFLKRLVEKVPENLVARLLLTETYIQNNKADEALAQLEELARIFPESPEEAKVYYDNALNFLQSGNAKDAFTPIKIYHNFYKVSSPYQAGIQELKGPGGELIGFPLITMGESTSTFWFEGEDLMEVIRFTDVTTIVGLDRNLNTGDGGNHVSSIALADFDGDSDLDIYFSRYSNDGSDLEHYLYRNDMGSYIECSEDVGIIHSSAENDAIFGDYDNDGYLDLHIVKIGENILYKNTGKGEFNNVSDNAKVNEDGTGTFSLLFDMDHDGDLDIFLANESENIMFQNNGDETFTDVAQHAGINSIESFTTDACFGDFDDDGDIDLLVLNKNNGNILFTNKRQGRFENITEATGLKNSASGGFITAGDYNNDGYLDLFIASGEAGVFELYKNRGDGTFEIDNRSSSEFELISHVKGYDVTFFDFDNDGHEDIIISGQSTQQGSKGVILLHNDGTGIYENVSHVLPDNLMNGRKVEVGDFNEDGDQDIYICDQNGNLHLLRNDGGNANHFLKLSLVGVRTGSSKNNYFGIGSKVEVRAGDLYQMKVITSPDTHFGLGDRSGADVVRILWPNGTPQNIFTPVSDQDLIEEQELKGSCPFLYTWNGKKFTFVKDMMWRSALGMPLGIMGEDTKYAFADASQEYLKIPGELLQEKDGKYSIRVTSELWETMYYDRIHLIAVDHPIESEIFVDERFIPPPYPDLKIYNIAYQNIPVTAVDRDGHDLLPYINKKDDNYISNFKLGQFQGITEMKDIVLDLGEDILEDNIVLFLNGWIFPTDASINIAISQSTKTKVIPPYIQVLDENGKWITINDNIGFPMGKDKTVIVDLSNKFQSAHHKVKISTNMQIYWDYIFFSANNINDLIHVEILEPEMADLHYRGFSKSFRKGGRYGPHWFDYQTVSEEPKWRDLEGNYTRYGDVIPLLLEPDNKYIIANAGDEISIDFDAINLPELPIGWKRDFLIYSVGWVKDGDLNTAYGQTVAPLPFHSMKSYPSGINEQYPNDKEYIDYMNKYNTREITSENFKRAIYDLY